MPEPYDVIAGIAQRDIRAGEIVAMRAEDYRKIVNAPDAREPLPLSVELARELLKMPFAIDQGYAYDTEPGGVADISRVIEEKIRPLWEALREVKRWDDHQKQSQFGLTPWISDKVRAALKAAGAE